MQASVDFYTEHFGFEERSNYAPAFAEVVRGNLRLLLSGPTSSAGRPMSDGAEPGPGGWNRIHLVVDDLASEVARLEEAGLEFRNDIVTGPAARRLWSSTPPATSSSSSNSPATDRGTPGQPLTVSHRFTEV